MVLNTLIAECTAYDFKLKLKEKRPKIGGKIICAFANGLGGSLFCDINNDGKWITMQVQSKKLRCK